MSARLRSSYVTLHCPRCSECVTVPILIGDIAIYESEHGALDDQGAPQ